MRLKKIALLGATGSIGSSTLKVLRQHPDRFHLESAAAGSRWQELLPILREFEVGKAVLFDEAAAEALRKEYEGEILFGMPGLLALCDDPDVDTVLNGLVGAIGCQPTVHALRHGKEVGLANKETMVMAGPLIRQVLREYPKSRLVPIDSEHSAIFQCIAGRPEEEIETLVLTASGGPFRERPAETFAKITLAEALKHPTWTMGRKITIDSATLMNKGLEVIEAHFLFGVPLNRIEVAVHPTSIVHSCVQFRDGSLMAQMGCPDMQLPIQYALSYPERLPLKVDRIDLRALAKLEFFSPDFEKFPCLALAYEAGRQEGVAPAVLNAANEIAVAGFLEEKIRFTDIPHILEKVLGEAPSVEPKVFEDFIDADEWARQAARRLVTSLETRGG
jgi:1-deoxy-D-xylulose-5-phosphate reductoisomerase